MNTKNFNRLDRNELIEKTFDLEDQQYAEKVREALFNALDITEARDVYRTMVYRQAVSE